MFASSLNETLGKLNCILLFEPVIIFETRREKPITAITDYYISIKISSFIFLIEKNNSFEPQIFSLLLPWV